MAPVNIRIKNFVVTGLRKKYINIPFQYWHQFSRCLCQYPLNLSMKSLNKGWLRDEENTK